MAFIWEPRLYNGSTALVLPQPMIDVQIRDKFHQDRHTVPFKAGGVTYGPALESTEISLSCGISRQGDTEKVSEQEMFTTFSDIRDYLNTAAEAENGLEFFLYYDSSGSGTYRKFKSVFCDSMSLGMGDEDRTLFGFEISLYADDPVIYTTAPGA